MTFFKIKSFLLIALPSLILSVAGLTQAEPHLLPIDVAPELLEEQEILPPALEEKPVKKTDKPLDVKMPVKNNTVAPITPITFSAECQTGQRHRIVAVGDVLLHSHLQRQAAAGSFSELWQNFTPYFQDADIAYANLEGPTAAGVNVYGRDVPDPGPIFDKMVYNSYPQFNYPPRLLDDLVASGFDVVSTGNNHALDRGGLGVDRTINALEKVGLNYTGSRRAVLPQTPLSWQTIVQRNGLTTAWIACTYDTNGLIDRKQQILLCYQQADEIKQLIAQVKNQVDAVIITPHWGWENSITPQAKQITLAKELLESGALAIIGSHPHTPQPMEKYVTSDGRETFILYSLGNFVSGQRRLSQKSAMILLLDLVKKENNTLISRVQFIPAFMANSQRPIELLPLSAEGGHPALKHLLKILPAENMAFTGQEMALNQFSPTCATITAQISAPLKP